MFHCFVFLWLMSHREISSRLKPSSLPTHVFNEEEHSFACSYTSLEQMSANFTMLTLTRNMCVYRIHRYSPLIQIRLCS